MTVTIEPNKKNDFDIRSLLAGAGRKLISDFKNQVKIVSIWGMLGAVIGGLLLGGAGVYFLGWSALAVAAGIGSCLGGIGAVCLYLSASAML